MYRYTLLESDKAFLDQVAAWKAEGVRSVAMDFEGEFNLHVYGEHLCLVQLYDGSRFFLVDPFKVSWDALRPFFTDKDLEKVLFAAEGDAALLRKVSGIQMEGVWDVRVQAMALGFMGNLVGLMDRYGLQHPRENKKKSQTANWMRRPLAEDLVQYALGDVAQLLRLKDLLAGEVAAKGLEKRVLAEMKRCAKPKHPERPGWEKLPGWRFMRPDAQERARVLFEARDAIARRRNVPASRVLDKHVLSDLAQRPPKDAAALGAACRDREMARKAAEALGLSGPL